MAPAMSLIPLLGLGLALGLRHAADPDHVVAVTAITARARRVLPAMWLGVVWGIGHTVTLFTVGRPSSSSTWSCRRGSGSPWSSRWGWPWSWSAFST